MLLPAVVLAAGRSLRMGRPKALLPAAAGGETFVERLVSTLAAGGIEDVVVVAGGEHEEVRQRLGLRARVAINPNPDRGQLSSVLVGLDVIDHPGVQAMLVAPVDQPFVSAVTVRSIADAWRRTRAPIVRPVRDNRHGHPVIFGRDVFDDLRRADPSVGAKAVVHQHAERAVDVTVDDDGAFADIDTPADYARWVGLKL